MSLADDPLLGKKRNWVDCAISTTAKDYHAVARAPSPSSDQSFGAPHRGSESTTDGSHDLE
jgi:hypothetical protein